MDNKKDFNFTGPNTMSYSKEQLASFKEGTGEVKKHYEFWGTLLSNFNLAKIIIFILVLIIMGLLCVVFSLSHKPALVFRTTDNGKSASYVPANPDSVFNEELTFVTRQFIENHTDLNPVSVEKSLEDALKMTTKPVREELITEIHQQDYIGTARKYKPTYNLEIGDIAIKTREHPYYKTYCIVNINYLKPKNFIRVHIYELTWRKYPRTDSNPSGLFLAKLDHYDQGDIKTNLNKN